MDPGFRFGGRLSAKGARIEALQAPNMGGYGEGCPLPHLGEVWGGATAPPRIFFNFGVGPKMRIFVHSVAHLSLIL